MGDSLVRPAPNRKKCILCRYSASDIYGDLQCIFLFEMAMFHKFQVTVECPMKVKEDAI